jgi:hypothetical protein
VIGDLLQDCSQHRPLGVWVAAKQQPTTLPGVLERWKFIEPTLQKAPLIKIVPMLGSLGCPYTCSFCIDSVVPYQPLDLGVIKEDLRFLLGKFRRPRVGWHDPNFGVQFNATMNAIEEAVPHRMISSPKSSFSCRSFMRRQTNGSRPSRLASNCERPGQQVKTGKMRIDKSGRSASTST